MGGMATTGLAHYGKTLLQTDNTTTLTIDVMFDSFFVVAKAGRDFVKGDKEPEQKKPKGPQLTE